MAKLAVALALFGVAVAHAALVATTTNLNIRSGSGTTFSVLWTAGVNEVFDQIGTSGDWAKVQAKSGSRSGTIGWASSGYLDPVRCPTASLNIRSGAGTGFGILLTASTTTWMRVVSTSNGWSNVVLLSGDKPGLTGWASASYIGVCGGGSVTPTAPPSGPVNYAELIPIPPGLSGSLTRPDVTWMTNNLGRPGCPLTSSCFSCTCSATLGLITKNKKTLDVGPFKVTGLAPFVDALKAAFDQIAREKPALYAAVKTAGGLCCRPIKNSNGSAGSGYSNHSWGLAIDVYFGAAVDPRGDNKTQRGLAELAPYFARQGLYWAAYYGGSAEDAMHFEASKEIINQWLSNGKLVR